LIKTLPGKGKAGRLKRKYTEEGGYRGFAGKKEWRKPTIRKKWNAHDENAFRKIIGISQKRGCVPWKKEKIAGFTKVDSIT